MWFQKQVSLKARARGFHLITSEILEQLPELQQLRVGLLHVFLQHTSASLTLNENADPAVRRDFEAFFNRAVAENEAYYEHTDEGSDDLPAHLKSSLLGCGITIPVTDGRLSLGTWQGVYLCEHRNQGGSRRVMVTMFGE